MNAKQMLQMGGHPDTDEGRAAFYSDHPTKESFMMKYGGQLSGAPHNGQPTEQQFFSWGEPINGPRGFYQPGGAVTPAMMMNSFSGPQPLNRNTYRPWTYPGSMPATDTEFTNPVIDSIPQKQLAPNSEEMMLKNQQMKGFSSPGSLFRPSGNSGPWGNESAQLGPAQFGGQPTAQEFFAWGEPIMGPQGFYQDGGSNSPLGYGAFPTMQNGGTNTQDINGATGEIKKSFMNYIQENVQKDAMKKEAQAMEQMMLQQYMMQGMMRHGGGLPKAQQMGQFNKANPFAYDLRRDDELKNFNGVGPDGYNKLDLNNIQMQGSAPMSMDPLNQTNALGSIDFSKADVSASAFPHTAYQGSDQPPYENGKTQYMLEPAVNTGNQMGMDWRNPQQEPSYTGNAAYNYNPIMMDENQTKGMPISSEAEITPGMKGELQRGRGKKNNPLLPYALLTGVRGATWLASADERRREKEQMAKYDDVDYWAKSRGPGDRGNYTQTGEFRPNATGATVDPWGNANMKGQMGNPYYTAAYGGEQEGGQVEEMTDAQIQQFLEMGGQLEILD